MTISEILVAIFQGDLDDDLDQLRDAYLQRTDRIAKEKFKEINVGSLVRFNDRTRPEYLQGALATVSEKKVTKITVKLGEDRGRYAKGSPILTSVHLVDLISIAEED